MGKSDKGYLVCNTTIISVKLSFCSGSVSNTLRVGSISNFAHLVQSGSLNRLKFLSEPAAPIFTTGSGKLKKKPASVTCPNDFRQVQLVLHIEMRFCFIKGTDKIRRGGKK